MSITDGQVVLRPRPGGSDSPILVDPRLSVSRIGSRAYPPALEDLATQIRCFSRTGTISEAAAENPLVGRTAAPEVDTAANRNSSRSSEHHQGHMLQCVSAFLSGSMHGQRCQTPLPCVASLYACRRYELVQAADAQRFGVGASGEADRQQRERAAALQAALTQPPGRPVSLQREVTPLQASASLGLNADSPSPWHRPKLQV